MTSLQRHWDTHSVFHRCTGKDVIVTEKGVVLRRGQTIADEIGNCNVRDQERVAGLREARKEFAIREFDTDRATLCPYLDCDRDDGELDIVVNGHPIRLKWRGDRPYWEDRWTPVEIPVEHLRAGTNEFVFQAVGDLVLVDAEVEVEVEALDRLFTAEASPSQPPGELLVLASCDLILDEERQEL